MKPNGHAYRTLDGRRLSLRGLSEEEERTLADIQRAYRRRPDWVQFTNFWRTQARRLYRDLPPSKRTSTIVYLIGEDLEVRLGVSQKYFGSPDYRDELRGLIAESFRSRYAFCQATGLDQGFLSRLLRKSSDISVERLNRALRRIGWELRLTRTAGADSKKGKAGTKAA